MALWTYGWVQLLRIFLFASSWNTICPNFCRSMWPSFKRISCPKLFTIIFHAALPGSTTTGAYQYYVDIGQGWKLEQNVSWSHFLYLTFSCNEVCIDNGLFHLLKLHPYWGTFWGFDPQDIITKPIIPLDAIKFGDNPPMDQLKHKKIPWDILMKSNPASIGQIKISLVPLYLVELPPQTPNNKHDTP